MITFLVIFCLDNCFKFYVIIKRLPRLILEPECRRMGKNIALAFTEKSIIRIIKLVAGEKK